MLGNQCERTALEDTHLFNVYIYNAYFALIQIAFVHFDYNLFLWYHLYIFYTSFNKLKNLANSLINDSCT